MPVEMFVLDVTDLVNGIWGHFVKSGETHFNDWFFEHYGARVTWGTLKGDPYHTVEFETEAELIQFKLQHS